MKVHALVESCLAEVDEVGCRDRHAVQVDLSLDDAHRGVEGGDR